MAEQGPFFSIFIIPRNIDINILSLIIFLVLFELNKKSQYVGAYISTLPIAFYPLDDHYQVPFPAKISPFGQKCEWVPFIL